MSGKERIAKRIVRVPMQSSKRKRKGQVVAVWEADHEFGTEIVDMHVWGQLRWLIDTDIKSILKGLGAVGHKLDPAGAERLKEEINRLVGDFNSERRERRPPHEQVRQMEPLRKSLARSIRHLHKSGAQLCDAQRFLVELDAPDSDAERIRKKMLTLDVATAVGNIHTLLRLAIFFQGVQRARQHKDRKPDHLRYLFVSRLTSVFKKTFKVPVSNYVAGPWCIFVASVFTACERKPMDAEGARSLWRSVKKAGMDRPDAVAARMLRKVLAASYH